jgi:hypothetical protein
MYSCKNASKRDDKNKYKNYNQIASYDNYSQDALNTLDIHNQLEATMITNKRTTITTCLQHKAATAATATV